MILVRVFGWTGVILITLPLGLFFLLSLIYEQLRNLADAFDRMIEMESRIEPRK